MVSPKVLVEAAARYPEIRTLALTDINNCSAAAEFTQLCVQHGIRPILGIEFRSGGEFLGVGLARTASGWQKLCKALTRQPHTTKSLRRSLQHSDDLYLILSVSTSSPLEDHEYIGLKPAEIHRLRNPSLMRKAIAWWPVVCTESAQRRTHDLLRAIEMKRLYDLRSLPTSSELCLEEPCDLIDAFSAAPVLLARANHLMETCDQVLQLGTVRDRQTFSGASHEDMRQLTLQSKRGLRLRYGQAYRQHLPRLEHELALIDQLGMGAYFMICWDLTRFARRSGIRHVGRGSGGNSLCAYCLRITNVDPVRLRLHFDRFLNSGRSKPPDFDLDFAWSRRDAILDYLMHTYAEHTVALLSTYSTFKGRAVVWEVGRVLGLSRDEIKVIVEEPKRQDKHHPLAELIFRYGRDLVGSPNYLSVHSGGLIIAEESITKTSALWTAPKGYSTTYFDMHHAELLGYHKYDVLSQRALGYLGDLEAQLPPSEWEYLEQVENIERDSKTMHLLQTGSTMGSFYIESPAMQSLLRKVPCKDYEDLVEVSSIIRPGVAQSGMMRAYIRRARGLEQVSYAHPDLQDCVSGQGIMIFQEDVMKVVQRIAGFDSSQADRLRKMMTGKAKSQQALDQIKVQFYSGAQQQGYPVAVVNEIWRQVASFQGYSFCKAHSASYAVESMQSLYLKAHHPGPFMESVINNGGGYYDLEIYLIEARRMGLIVERPCLRYGSYLAKCRGSRLYLGFKHIKQLGPAAGKLLLTRIDNLAELTKLRLTSRQLWLLYRAGALRNLMSAENEVEQLYQALAYVQPSLQLPLFDDYSLAPDLALEGVGALTRAQEDLEIFGFAIEHPFDLLPGISATGDSDWRGRPQQQVTVVGYLLHKKPVTTVRGKHMNFAFWLGSDGQYFESVHWQDSLKKAPFQGRGVYRLTGRVQQDFGESILMVHHMTGKSMHSQLVDAASLQT